MSEERSGWSEANWWQRGAALVVLAVMLSALFLFGLTADAEPGAASTAWRLAAAGGLVLLVAYAAISHVWSALPSVSFRPPSPGHVAGLVAWWSAWWFLNGVIYGYGNLAKEALVALGSGTFMALMLAAFERYRRRRVARE